MTTAPVPRPIESAGAAGPDARVPSPSGRPRIGMVAASLDILGGQCVQAVNLAAALRGEGMDVTYIPINPPFPAGLRWLRRLRYARTLLNETLYLPSLARLRMWCTSTPRPTGRSSWGRLRRSRWRGPSASG